MIYFHSDYAQGAHPKVLQRLIETNEVSTPGYGNDTYTAAAKDKVAQLYERWEELERKKEESV